MRISFYRRCIAIVAFVLSSGEIAAQSGDTPANYSHILPLSFGSNQAVVQLHLPRAVYLAARSPALHDLRVFDAVGTSMPYALVDQTPPSLEKRPSAPVAIFPLHGASRDAGNAAESLQIRTRHDGAVISVTTPSRAANDELQSLILDLQPAALAAHVGTAMAVGALALSLPQGMDSYSAHVALDVSDDLQSWEALTEAAVSWLVNDRGASVRKYRIEFAPQPFRYARIRWLEGKPVAFSEINAEYVVQEQAARQLEAIIVPGVPALEGRDLLYATPIAIPALSLGFVFQGQNVVMSAMVGQYRTTQDRKPGTRVMTLLHPLVNTTFYQLTQKGQQRVSGDVEIEATHASAWIARPLSDLAERPALRLRWAPATMVFVASGKPPYMLAFGRDGARAVQVQLHQVAPGFSARELRELDMATAGNPVQQTIANPAQAVDTDTVAIHRRLWLWGVLLCGLAVLAGMAWHLFHQIKSNTPEQPHT